MEYWESLEEWGVKIFDDIERKVFLYRKKLEFDYGFFDGLFLFSCDRDFKSGDFGGERILFW